MISITDKPRSAYLSGLLLKLGAVGVTIAYGCSPESLEAQVTDRRSKVYQLLCNAAAGECGTGVLVGQVAADLNGVDNFVAFEEALGVAPAIYHWEARWDWGEIGFDEYVTRAIAAWNRGSLVAVGWVDKNPPLAGATLADCDRLNPKRNHEAYNQFWDCWVDELAGYLERLQQAGVVVLFRPLHEPENRAWIADGRHSFRNVWRQLYEELVERRKLSNLIFVLGLDHTRDHSYLPDPDYIDVVGTSEYVNPPYKKEDFDHLVWLRSQELYKSKPVAICETGSLKNKGNRSKALDYLEAINRYAPFVCYLSWWHDSTDNDYQWALYQAEQAELFIEDCRVVNRARLNKVVER